MARSTANEPDTVIIKKYANRRLYNTATSAYVTLQDLADMVKESVDFTVRDAKTGEDITRSVLTQIIVEQETKGNNLLPISFLRQLIGFYGDNLQNLVPQYLDMTMQSFSHNQDRMRECMENTLGGVYSFPALEALEEIGRQNMALFEQAGNMMTLFRPTQGEEKNQNNEKNDGAGDRSPPDEFERLKEQMAAMQRQIDSLASSKE